MKKFKNYWWGQTTASDLQQEMCGTTAVFGRDKSIQVTFGGDKARKGDGVGAELATAKRKLEMLIMATKKLSWDSMKERGRLDNRRLLAGYNGDLNVFKVKRDESDLDTVVGICIDMSGSMRGSGKSAMAFKATIVLSELLQKVGVPFEVTGFSSWSLSATPVGARFAEESHSWGRTNALLFHEFKRFGDRFFDARQYMAKIDDPRGGNIDGESILLAAKRMLKRPEKRKILFVLSDGQPADDGNNNRLYGHTQRTVKELERQMEVVGIGLMSNTVKEFYKTHVVLKSPLNLPTTMLDLLASKMLPGKKGTPLPATEPVEVDWPF